MSNQNKIEELKKQIIKLEIEEHKENLVDYVYALNTIVEDLEKKVKSNKSLLECNSFILNSIQINFNDDIYNLQTKINKCIYYINDLSRKSRRLELIEI